jgi:hypothetical protein
LIFLIKDASTPFLQSVGYDMSESDYTLLLAENVTSALDCSLMTGIGFAMPWLAAFTLYLCIMFFIFYCVSVREDRNGGDFRV